MDIRIIIICLIICVCIFYYYNKKIKKNNKPQQIKSAPIKKTDDELTFLNNNYEQNRLQQLKYLISPQDDENIKSTDLFK